MKSFIGTLTFYAALALAAEARAGSEPSRTEICDDNGRVIRSALATWALDKAAVPRRLEDSAARIYAANAGLSVREQMVAAPNLCATVTCLSGDADVVSTAQTFVENMLRGEVDGYAPMTAAPADRPYNRRAYFVDRVTEITCPAAGSGGSSAASGTPLPFRLRGSTESLNITRDDPALAAETAASVAFTDDNVKNKKTEKITLVVGVPITIPTSPGSRNSFEIVPYFAMVRDLAREAGKDTAVTTDTWSVGAALNAFVTTKFGDEELVSRFTVRPDYLRNNEDTSEVGSLTVSWSPVLLASSNHKRPFGVNSYAPLGTFLGEELQWATLFDVRAVHGEFLERGTRAEDLSEDYTRLGSRLGVAFGVNELTWPIDLVVTDTYLASLRGGDDLEYLQARLSLAFTKSRLVTVDLTYSDGRKSDFDVDEDVWKLSLGAKF